MEAENPTADHPLMLAVRDGDLDAMGTLFERHHGPLFGYLVKLTGNRTAEPRTSRRSSSSGC